MGIYVSAGVYSKEKDISEIIPNLSTTTAGIVGYSAKGDTTRLRLMTNTQQFIQQYGQPVPGNYFHYSGLAYLENGQTLWCKRVVNGALYGGVKIKTSVSSQSNAAISAGAITPDFVTVSGEDNLFYVYGANPGVWNNNIGIRITSIDPTELTFNIEVYFTDANGITTRVENWIVSRQVKIDGYGKQLYLEDKINGFSSYIVVADDTTQSSSILPKGQSSTLVVAQGDDGSALTDGNLITGWQSFANPDDIDIRLLIGAGATSVAVQQAMKTIAEDRKDCIALLDMPYAQLTDVSSMVTWRTSTQNFNSSYTALYAPWVKMYDPYNDLLLEIPPSGYVASQIAYNDYQAEVWYAPAGFNRGILNVLGLTNVFTQGERDTLYPAGINPLQTFRGEGNVIWGQKTQQTKASALDRVNVRRLLITLEKAISVALRTFVFEPNSEVTRFRIVSMCEQYLDQLSAKGAFQTELGDKGYLVVCDETNNTPATIDANELHVDIFIKPSRAAEYIQLQTIITSTGASFTELVARGVNL
jgi:hypothetical protein